MYDFLTDLDEYFCENYANYDKFCALPGYKMPVMQATRLDEYGRTYAYTLPASTMRLAAQEKKAELLAQVKERLVDNDFSFSFQPLRFIKRVKNRLSKEGFCKTFKGVLQRYGLTEESGVENLSVDKEIWRKICKGSFLPSKNLLLSFALSAQLSLDDGLLLLQRAGEGLEDTSVKDVVVCYLLQNKIYDKGMIEAALQEYKISNLFLS